MTRTKEPFNGWPFRSWAQGYVLGVINGALIGLVIGAGAILLSVPK